MFITLAFSTSPILNGLSLYLTTICIPMIHLHLNGPVDYHSLIQILITKV